jgi:hypothetical protein
LLTTIIVLAVVVAFIITFHGIIKGPVRPQVAAWIGWLFADIVTLYSSYRLGGVGDPTFILVLPYMVGAVSVLILALFLKKGKGGTTPFDWSCILLCILGSIASGYYGKSDLGIVSGTTALLVSGIPNIDSAWKRPEEEPIHLWWLFLLAATLTLINNTSLKQWHGWLFPAFDSAYVLTILYCYYFSPHKIKSD